MKVEIKIRMSRIKIQVYKMIILDQAVNNKMK